MNKKACFVTRIDNTCCYCGGKMKSINTVKGECVNIDGGYVYFIIGHYDCLKKNELDRNNSAEMFPSLESQWTGNQP